MLHKLIAGKGDDSRHLITRSAPERTDTRLSQPQEIVLLFALVALAILIRLVNISQPFIDEWSWRQTDVAMIAENFYQNGFNIFYPQVNWAGNSPGYVGTEFPLVPFIASLLYLVFGVHEWIGRSISIFFFALSLPFLYLLVREVFNRRSALLAVAIYNLVPLGIFASRSFMSDMTSLSFSIVALYFFAEWLNRLSNKSKFLIAASTAASLAILVKLPAIIIGIPLIYMAWEEYGAKMVLKRDLWAFAALSLIFPLAWYSHAYLISVSHFPHHMFGSEGIGLETLTGYREILREAATSSLTPLLSATMLVGIFLSSPTKFGRVFHCWLLAIFLFAIIAGRGHYRHSWYLLPMVPVAAFFSGRACDFVLSRIAQSAHSKFVIALTCFIFFVSLSYLSLTYLKPLYNPWGLPFFNAGTELNRIAPRHALAIVVDGGDPTCLYYSKRKGWHFLDNFGIVPGNSQQAIIELEKLRKRGARYLVFPRYTVWWLDYYKDFRTYLDSRYRRVRQTTDYVIFDLAARNRIENEEEGGARHAQWRN
jgi:4-amino-4-deoxy-L-arabinose transferase-like glycosyltransferase